MPRARVTVLLGRWVVATVAALWIVVGAAAVEPALVWAGGFVLGWAQRRALRDALARPDAWLLVTGLGWPAALLAPRFLPLQEVSLSLFRLLGGSTVRGVTPENVVNLVSHYAVTFGATGAVLALAQWSAARLPVLHGLRWVFASAAGAAVAALAGLPLVVSVWGSWPVGPGAGRFLVATIGFALYATATGAALLASARDEDADASA